MQNKNLNEGALGQSQQVARKRWRVDYAANKTDADARGGQMRVFDSMNAAMAFAEQMRADGRFDYVEIIDL